MTIDRALLLIVFTFQFAFCQAASGQVENSVSNAEFATIHIRKNTGALFEFVAKMNGQELGSLYGKKEYFTVQLPPGRHVFESWTSFGRDTPGLLSVFDLEVTAGAEAVLECYGPQGWSGLPPKDAVLQAWEKYCPDGDLTESNGVTTCIKPYHEHNQKVLRKRYSSGKAYLINEPHGGCYLPDVFDSLDAKMRRDASVEFIANAAFVYSRAEEQNTAAAYQDFIGSYPDSPLIEKANDQLALLEQQEIVDAQQQKIQAVMQRDARLPLEVRKDKYILSLTDHLNNQNFGEALFYIELLDQLNVELSPSFEYFWGESLLRIGEPEKALDKLYSYVSKAGSGGQYYTQALKLSTEAEKELSASFD